MDLIKDIILEGLIKDLRVAERSYQLSKNIGQSNKKLSNPSKRKISAILFNLAYTDLVLGLARIYDKPSKKYPTRCLGRLYEIIEDSKYEIEISNREDSILNLSYFGFNQGQIDLLRNSSKQDFNKRAKGNFEFREYNKPLSSHIKKIKEIRDKLLAHNEDIKINKFVKYETIESLLDHAKNIISFYLLTYCGINLKNDPNFYLSFDFLDWSNTYNEFLEKL